MKDCISVIIPVYNVEKYLARCVDSVLTQTYTNLEIILVDDGSTDGSGKLCDEYKEKDARIKVMHKENGGLSDARNAGLDIAKGDYIAFIDSDDFYYDMNCMADIIENVKEYNSDLILIPNASFFENNDEYRYKNKKYSNWHMAGNEKKDALLYAMKYDAFKACAWDKVVKRSIIEKNNLRFLYGKLSEDIDWTARLLLACNSFSCLERPVYAYRQRDGSISHSASVRHVHDILNQIEELLKAECDCNNEYLLRTYLAHNYVMLIEYYNKVETKEKKQFYARIKELSFLLNYNQSYNVKKVKFAKSILGFIGMRNLLKIVR